MIGFVIALIVFIVIVAVLIIHTNILLDIFIFLMMLTSMSCK